MILDLIGLVTGLVIDPVIDLMIDLKIARMVGYRGPSAYDKSAAPRSRW